MPSSPTTPATASTTTTLTAPNLLDVLAGVSDHRGAKGKRFSLPALLALALAAVTTGARSYAAIGEFAAAEDQESLTGLGITGAIAPSERTFRRTFADLDADDLDNALGAWMWTRTGIDAQGRRVIAVDGKTVRGARTRNRAAPHLVAAFDHDAGTVLGQLAISLKSNEIPAVRTLLASFDLDGVVVTIDAMHTQDDTARLILDGGGDYVFTVKGNRPTQFGQCKKLPWKNVPSTSSTDTGHGRRVTRRIQVLDVPAWIVFPGARQIAKIHRTVTCNGKKTVEVAYVITSASHQAAPPAVLAGWVQTHWRIEVRLHWVRDVTFDEDRSQIRTGNSPRVMATLRNMIISLLRLDGWTNIAAGLRHHARTPGAALELVLTC